MSEANPYSAPQAEISMPSTSRQGSFATAVRGDYQISVGEVISEGWTHVRGLKWKLVVATLILVAVIAPFQWAVGRLGLDGQTQIAAGQFWQGMAIASLSGLLILPLSVPLITGMFMMCIKHVAGKPTGIGEMFAYFGKLIPLLLANMILTLTMYLGFVLLIIPGVYGGTVLMFSVPLVAAFDLSPVEAARVSFQTIRHRWLTLVGLWLVLMIIVMFSIIPLGIGLLWSIPLCMTALSVCFVRMFGVDWPTDKPPTAHPG